MISPVPSQISHFEPSAQMPRPRQVGHFLSFSTDKAATPNIN
jgi:hypothetical protein